MAPAQPEGTAMCGSISSPSRDSRKIRYDVARSTMGRRSNFPRPPNDAYVTPLAAVTPLVPFLKQTTAWYRFEAEPASTIFAGRTL